MRTVTDVVFDHGERDVMVRCSRWVGAVDPDPSHDIERGGLAVSRAERNHAYSHTALSLILVWIDASLDEFTLRQQEAQRLISAEVPRRPDGGAVPLVENPAVAGHVLHEAAVEALTDLHLLRTLIVKALMLATSPVADPEHVDV